MPSLVITRPSDGVLEMEVTLAADDLTQGPTSGVHSRENSNSTWWYESCKKIER